MGKKFQVHFLMLKNRILVVNFFTKYIVRLVLAKISNIQIVSMYYCTLSSNNKPLIWPLLLREFSFFKHSSNGKKINNRTVQNFRLFGSTWNRSLRRRRQYNRAMAEVNFLYKSILHTHCTLLYQGSTLKNFALTTSSNICIEQALFIARMNTWIPKQWLSWLLMLRWKVYRPGQGLRCQISTKNRWFPLGIRPVSTTKSIQLDIRRRGMYDGIMSE